MADPLQCLRGATIAIAVWNIIYSLIQLAIFGWQTRYVRDLQWMFGNRPLPPFDPYQSYFPGVYSIYSESPEQRRLNALFALAVATLFFSFAHLCLTSVLLIGSAMQRPNAVWPWFFSAIPLIALSTAYAVLWWSGDVFGIQLTMSVAEFVMSLAVNSICAIVVAFYYFRLRGYITSVRPKRVRIYDDASSQHSYPDIPDWRLERDEEPPEMLEKRLQRERAAAVTAAENALKRAMSRRENDIRRSRREERRTREPHPIPLVRETIPRSSMKRRPQSEPRAPQRRAHPIEVHRSRSPMRTLPPLQRGLTSERLRAHDKALQKLYDRPTAAVLTKGLPRVMV